MEFRPAVSADAPQIAAIYNYYVAHSTATFRYLPQPMAEVEEAIAGSGKFPFLVACEGETIVGYACAHSWMSGIAFAWDAEISVYCRQDICGKGVGRKLCTALLEILKRQGYCNAVSWVAQPNPASGALFAALGFTPCTALPHMGFKAGTWQGLQLWILPLRQEEGRPAAIRPLSAQELRETIEEALKDFDTAKQESSQ